MALDYEKLQKDAARLAEIVARILSMQYEAVQSIMTIFGYMVLNFVKAIAKMQKHDADKEMAKFIDYLTEIYAQDKKYKPKEEKKSNIINLN